MTTCTIESEIPEALYNDVQVFLSTNQNLDRSALMAAAIGLFLMQKGFASKSGTRAYMSAVLPECITSIA
jgi:hypothetical protein